MVLIWFFALFCFNFCLLLSKSQASSQTFSQSPSIHLCRFFSHLEMVPRVFLCFPLRIGLIKTAFSFVQRSIALSTCFLVEELHHSCKVTVTALLHHCRKERGMLLTTSILVRFAPRIRSTYIFCSVSVKSVSNAPAHGSEGDSLRHVVHTFPTALALTLWHLVHRILFNFSIAWVTAFLSSPLHVFRAKLWESFRCRWRFTYPFELLFEHPNIGHRFLPSSRWRSWAGRIGKSEVVATIVLEDLMVGFILYFFRISERVGGCNSLRCLLLSVASARSDCKGSCRFVGGQIFLRGTTQSPVWSNYQQSPLLELAPGLWVFVNVIAQGFLGLDTPMQHISNE